jgi:2-methylcitrate dehydratase PrpD
MSESITSGSERARGCNCPAPLDRFHGGWASHAGVVAAELAQHGITAPRTSIDGKSGYLHAYSGDPLP